MNSKQKSNHLHTLVEKLQSDKWLTRSHASFKLEALVSDAGEIVTPLHKITLARKSPAKHIAVWLISQIGKQTTSRWKQHTSHLLCPDCMIYCHHHTIQLPKTSVTFYGCRHCRQSRGFLDVSDKIVVAVLDDQMQVKYTEQPEAIRINWLIHRGLIDFDEVAFIQSTDEEAERFVVQLGNNTDQLRRPNYQNAKCKVSSGCNLSPNTVRILQKTFGKVTLSANNYADERP